MKSRLAMFWLTFLALGLSADLAAKSDEFYSTLAFRETPYADFRGVIPLTPEQAQERNHYRFRYDQQGRLTELSFRLGDRLRPMNHTANHFFHAPLTTIRSDGSRQYRRFFDHHGRPVLVDGAVLEEIHETDARGRRVALSFHGREGEPVENGWGIHRYDWRHDADGVVEWRKNLRGQTVDMRPHLAFRVVRFRYREDGLLDIMQNLDRDGRLLNNATGVAQDRLDYRSDGTTAGWAVLDAEGRPARGNHPNVSRGHVAVDRWGYESHLRFSDEEGAAIRNAFGWGQSRTDYDRFGNWSRRAFFDEAGKAMVVPELGYHGYRFAWDPSGRRLLSQWYEDTAGKRIAHAVRGFSGVVYEYGDGPDATHIRFLDPAGKPVARTDSGVATIERRYDSRGRWTEERFLDLQGRLVDDRRRGYARTELRYDATGVPLPPRRFTAAGDVTTSPPPTP